MDTKTCVTGSAYDYRKYEKIWKRVAPNMKPYPDMEEKPEDQAPSSEVLATPTVDERERSCCLQESPGAIDILERCIEVESADACYYTALACKAPWNAKSTLCSISCVEQEHSKRMRTLYYLMTGRCYRMAMHCEKIYTGPYCEALRERYHVEMCDSMYYRQLAESVQDECFKKELLKFADEEYHNAQRLADLLEKTMCM